MGFRGWLAGLALAVCAAWLGGRVGLLASLLFVAVYTDLLSRKIPNLLVFSGVLAGLASQVLLPEPVGLVAALQGVGLGFVLLLPLYLLRAMGAGDVKLMAMVGAFIGTPLIYGAVLGTFLAGGVLSLLVVLQRNAFGQMLKNLRSMLFDLASKQALGQFPVTEAPAVSVGQLPYAVAIALGTLGYLWLRAVGYVA